MAPHWHSADQIMRSPLGRQALREGWGRALFRLALQHGTPTNFSQDDRLQFSFAEGVNRTFFAQVEEAPDLPFRAPLLALWRAEMSLEHALHEHYAAKGRDATRRP